MKKKKKNILCTQYLKNVKRNIFGFHALTRCDTTSDPNGIIKKTALVKYITQPGTLEGVGRGGDALAVSKSCVCCMAAVRTNTKILHM